MAFWNKLRASRADRTLGARGRVPSDAKLMRDRLEAERRARRAREDDERRAIESAAEAALKRLEAAGFPGAVQMMDPKRKRRAAWHICDVTANRPHGETAVGSYYLFSTGVVADDRGRSFMAAHSRDEIIAGLDRIG